MKYETAIGDGFRKLLNLHNLVKFLTSNFAGFY